jgi:hypothetical protein
LHLLLERAGDLLHLSTERRVVHHRLGLRHRGRILEQLHDLGHRRRVLCEFVKPCHTELGVDRAGGRLALLLHRIVAANHGPCEATRHLGVCGAKEQNNDGGDDDAHPEFLIET